MGRENTMMKFSEIAQKIQASLFGPDMALPAISIDSRKIQPGECFVAIKGEQFDGHDYIAQAIEKGAKAIIAQRPPLNIREKEITFLEVKDTVFALGRIAHLWRMAHPIPMIGITGSCGKTTVKGMIASICQQQGKTLETKGNFNNHIGLPLTLLNLNAAYEFAVIEMGASQVGEIHYLGQIAQPTVSLITNIGPAHLQGFGSMENIAKAKAEIYAILPADGIAVVNIDEAYQPFWDPFIENRTRITYGVKQKTQQAMVRASEVKLQPHQVAFTLHIQEAMYPVEVPVPGEHTVMNALASAAAAFALGIRPENIVAGLAKFQGVAGRLAPYTGINNALLIDDTYNANPTSMSAALEVLAQYPGKKVFIMGDMAELGEDAINYHTQIGNTAKQKGIAHLWAVGHLTSHAVKAFGQGAQWYENKAALVEALKKELTADTVVLIKGSRSAAMDEVTSALKL